MKYQLIINKEQEEKITIVAHEKTKLINTIEAILYNTSPSILGYKNNEIYNIKYEDIYCVYTSNNKVFLLCDNEEYSIKQRINQMEESLPDNFIKINQGCVINMKYIKKFVAVMGSIKVVLNNDFEDYISRRELSKVKRRMGL